MTSQVEVAIFPGQGEQSKIPGMAEHLENTASNEIIHQADEILLTLIGRPVVREAITGGADLMDGVSIQAATYSVETAMYKGLQAQGLQPKLLVGHSLGEYAAIAAADVLTFEDGLNLVVARAEAMIDADIATPGGGGMAAISGLDREKVQAIAQEAESEVANFNSPQQFVISGIRRNVEDAARRISQLDLRGVSAKVLDIPYAAHSRWMTQAAEALRERAEAVEFKKPKIPFLSNRAEMLDQPDQFREHLPRQLYQGVEWHRQAEQMVHDQGLHVFSEVGPGQTLSRLLRRSFSDLIQIIPVSEFSKRVR